jgi:putative FmdB family regulatory protein
MPLYDYQCSFCGPFNDFRPLSEWDKRATCPSCGRLSKRCVAMPRLSCVSRNVRIAHERNELSAERPRLMSRKELEAAHGHIARHAHRRGRNMYRSSVLGHAH